MIISVFLIAAIVTLLNSVDRSITEHYGAVRRFSILTSQLERTVSPNVLAKVRRDPDVLAIIPATPTITNIRTVFGEVPVPLYGVDTENMEALARVAATVWRPVVVGHNPTAHRS
jgi:hypothetical protein